MHTFRTQFPINPKINVSTLLEVGKIWIGGSPHSSLSKMIDELDLNNGHSFLKDDHENIEFVEYIDDQQAIAGIRYINNKDKSLKWATEVVGAKINEEFWVSVVLDVSTRLPIGKIPLGKKPYIIKNIIKEIGGGVDGDITVSDKPVYFNDSQIDFVANIINGNSKVLMPVVYVSVTDNGSTYILPERLARWVSGMAHVLVEPNRNFSFNLMDQVFGDNAYGGAVAIYWPGDSRKWLFIPQAFPPDEMELKIHDKIRNALLTQEARRECTWSYLQDLVTKRKIEELKKSGTKAVDEYVKLFDSEIKRKDEKIEELKSEIQRLSFYGGPSINIGESSHTKIELHSNEKELYHGEFVDILIDILDNVLQNNISKNSRRYHIVKSIIDSSDAKGMREQIIDELKKILKNYTRMDSDTKRGLSRIGFDIISESRHYKLLFKNDERYPVILSKTSSDHRVGKNTIAKLKKILF